MRRSRICTLVFTIIVLSWLPEGNAAKGTISSIYGTVTIDTPIVKSLITNSAIKRLRRIDSAGPSRYFRSLPSYSIFDHALGMFVLLKKFDRPLKEQIAGMLEPVAHSAFSHQGTLLLKPRNSSKPYYLAAQKGVLKMYGISRILKKQGFDLSDINPENREFKALYKDPPKLSVVEIEMTLRLGFSYKLLSRSEIKKIISDLRFENGKWFFVSEKSALKLANLSLYFSEHYWGSVTSYVINRWVGGALKRAVSLGVITLKEIRYGVDKTILMRLLRIREKYIKALMIRCRQPFRFYEVVEKGAYDEIFKPDFRGVDPLVKRGEKFVRLSSINKKFAQDFKKLKRKTKEGIKIKYRSSKTNSRFNYFNDVAAFGVPLEVSFVDEANDDEIEQG